MTFEEKATQKNRCKTEQGKGLNKRDMRFFGDHRNVLDYGGGNTTKCICKNSLELYSKKGDI